MPSTLGADSADYQNGQRSGGYAENERYGVGCAFPKKISDKPPIQEEDKKKEEKQNAVIRTDKADFLGFFGRH